MKNLFNLQILDYRIMMNYLYHLFLDGFCGITEEIGDIQGAMQKFPYVSNCALFSGVICLFRVVLNGTNLAQTFDQIFGQNTINRHCGYS